MRRPFVREENVEDCDQHVALPQRATPIFLLQTVEADGAHDHLLPIT